MEEEWRSVMVNIFVSKIVIDKVRHLKNLEIELSTEEKKHLILTGKNGSGKTSLLNSIATFLNSITSSDQLVSAMKGLKDDEKSLILFKKSLIAPCCWKCSPKYI